MALIVLDRKSNVTDIIAKAKADFVLPNYDLEGLERWSTSRIVLIGDAAHVMPPHSGQGMSQVFEDAVCLAVSLRKHAKLQDGTWTKDRDSIENAFSEYFTSRKPRVYVYFYPISSSLLVTIILTFIF